MTVDSSPILSNQRSGLRNAGLGDLVEAAKYPLNDYDQIDYIHQDDESRWRHDVTIIKSLSDASINWNQTLRLYDSKVESDLVTGAMPEYQFTEQPGQSTNLLVSMQTEGVGKSSSLEKVRRFASMTLTPDVKHAETLHGVSIFRRFLVLTSCEVLLKINVVESAEICRILGDSVDPFLHLTEPQLRIELQTIRFLNRLLDQLDLNGLNGRASILLLLCKELCSCKYVKVNVYAGAKPISFFSHIASSERAQEASLKDLCSFFSRHPLSVCTLNDGLPRPISIINIIYNLLDRRTRSV